MSKKKNNPEQSRTERKHFKMLYAKPIKELYPEVTNISVSYITSLNETGGWKEKHGGPHNYGPDSKPLFDYDCPNIHCSGSFDLTDKIRDFIDIHTKTYSGQKICQYIVRSHPCWVQFNYTINIEYKTQEEIKRGQFFILDSDRELCYKNRHGETFKNTIPQCSLSCDESRQ